MDKDWTLNKSSRIVEDFSTAELSFQKHGTGPCLVFRETDTRFILTANLKGYKRENIKVEIDKGRKRVAVIGKKSVQGTTVVGNKVYTKEIETRGFKRAFHFSDGVIFDEMKARFDEQEFLLTIWIPKMKRGFRVTRIEEVTQEDIGGTYEPLQIEEKDDEKGSLEINKYREEDVKEEKVTDKDVGKVYKEELEKGEDVQELDQTRTERVQTFKNKRLEMKQESININKALQEHVKTREFEKKEEKGGIEGEGEGDSEGTNKDERPKTKKNKCKLCNPVILGSTILVTISVLVAYLVRTQNQHIKKKN